MYTKFLVLTALLSAAYASPNPVANPEPQITEGPSSISDLSDDQLSSLLSYQSSLSEDTAYSSAISVVQTAIPTSELVAVLRDPTSYAVSLATATAFPSWYTALPSSAKSVLSSAASVQIEILGLTGAETAPTAGRSALASGMSGMSSMATSGRGSTSGTQSQAAATSVQEESGSGAGSVKVSLGLGGIVGMGAAVLAML